MENYLQQWWEQKYPNAGVRNIINLSDENITLEKLIDFESWMRNKMSESFDLDVQHIEHFEINFIDEKDNCRVFIDSDDYEEKPY